MTNPDTRLYFDFVDPGSYLIHQLLERIGFLSPSLVLVGMELAIPPDEMIDPSAPEWRSYCDTVELLANESGCDVPRVDFLPWTRKAHELALHAAHTGDELKICGSLFRAHFVERRDLGRIDVLTQIAQEAGLDLTETKAVLDVDKYTQELGDRRTTALADGIVRLPTIRCGTKSLVGPAGIHDLRGLFDSPDGPISGT